jgi:hypothetical protein
MRKTAGCNLSDHKRNLIMTELYTQQITDFIEEYRRNSKEQV